jgi:hypothetical protein
MGLFGVLNRQGREAADVTAALITDGTLGNVAGRTKTCFHATHRL